MEVTFTKADQVSGRLAVSVVESDYREKVDAELRKIGRSTTIPGFRKGHVGLAELNRRFGQDVTSDVINREVYEAVMKYIDDNKLQVLGQPVPVEVVGLDLKNRKDYTFEYDLALAPELNVKLDKEVTLPYYDIQISDEMVKTQTEALRKRFGRQEPGPEFQPDALVKGTIFELNEDGTIKEGDDAIQVVNGIVGPQYFQDEEQKALFNGKKVGDTVRFNPWKTCNGNPAELASMLQIDKQRAADMHADFELTISEIIVVVPAEMNQEFYDQCFGADKVHSEEEFDAALRAMIASQLTPQSDMFFAVTTRDYFVKTYDTMPLPSDVLKKWLMMRNEGVTEANVDETYAQMVPDLKWQLIKESIARATNMTIEEADLKAYAMNMARRQFEQYGMMNMDDETVGRYADNILADKKYRSTIMERCGDMKLMQIIRQAVTIDDKKVTVAEFEEAVNATQNPE